MVFAAGFLAAVVAGFAAGFFATGFFAAAVFAAVVFAAGFLAAGFAAVVFAAGFLAAGFFAAGFLAPTVVDFGAALEAGFFAVALRAVAADLATDLAPFSTVDSASAATFEAKAPASSAISLAVLTASLTTGFASLTTEAEVFLKNFLIEPIKPILFSPFCLV